ncbi:hypothetical protein U9M48_009832 [Paspalum notatum var. saurae]|uniref:Uncharacterized protein n=1 Tax=Paspalum notatum var. saurae TaxID=547442 RepID=A0AAQ3WFC8_PASNO
MEGGGSSTPFYRGSTAALAANPCSDANGAQKGDREAAVDAEIARVNKLPAHSSYAVHRMKVLNKLRHLMSIKAVQNGLLGRAYNYSKLVG